MDHKGKRSTWLLYTGLGLFLCLWLSITIFLAVQYLSNKNHQAEDQIIKHVSELIQIDTGNLKIVTIHDAKKLRETDIFYQNAQDGDALIVWERKAIIYRPSINKIIDFGIVLETAVTASTSGNPTQP